MTRHLELEDDMKEYWAFYLLQGSSVTVSTCVRYTCSLYHHMAISAAHRKTRKTRKRHVSYPHADFGHYCRVLLISHIPRIPAAHFSELITAPLFCLSVSAEQRNITCVLTFCDQQNQWDRLANLYCSNDTSAILCGVCCFVCLSICPVFFNSCRRLPETKRHSSVSPLIWF